MKEYPLALKALREYEGPHVGWYSRGHHDPALFLAAILDEEGEEERKRVGPIRQECWRTIPDPAVGDGYCYFHPARPGSRGAFPVTVADKRGNRSRDGNAHAAIKR